MNMEIKISEGMRKFVLAFFLIILPIVIVLIGIFSDYLNAWFYILSITWFGTGLIIFTAID